MASKCVDLPAGMCTEHASGGGGGHDDEEYTGECWVQHAANGREVVFGTALILPQLRTHSLAPPYLDSDMSSRWFDFGGDTIIRADQYIRLASDSPSQKGWVSSRVPLTATNWEVEVEFKIHGKGNLHGDGFAMWISKDRASTGPVFGFQDRWEGLAVVFDTYKNNRPGVVFPYVMGMMGDGRTTYDSANDGKSNEIGGCSVRIYGTGSWVHC